MATEFVGCKLELRISCAKLRDTDLLSKSDPIVLLFVKNKSGSWIEHGRTEEIKNSVDPVFSKAIEINYYFEEYQELRFMVYDIDNATDTLADDDFLGQLECSLGEIVNERSFTRPLKYKSKTNAGTITIRAEELSNENSNIEFKFTGVGLDKKDFLGKSDPYLEFAKSNPDGKSFSVVYRTQYIKNTLDPNWPPFVIESRALCNNDPERIIKVTCYDWDSDGSHDLIGTFTTSLLELQTAAQQNKRLEWELINQAKKEKKKKYKNSGTIRLVNIKMTKLYSFLDYIMGGCTINFTVGIDFTASNGNPVDPNSLHYINPVAPNEYMRALRSVGYICQDYDTDKLFPSFGFGAQINGKVSHQFALNGVPDNPYCVGVEGIISAYHQAIHSVKLYGPTNMSPLINHVASFAEGAAMKRDSLDYFILLILTDGDITDMNDTKRAIIRASRLPMSIIIVGVGSCSFEKMVELDSDDKKLRIDLDVAARDIVQFVPFRQFAMDSTLLAKEVLAEVPNQLTEYMRMKGLSPLNKP